MQQRVKLQLAVMAASAIVVTGAAAAAVLTAPMAAGNMNVGQTATSTTAPSALATSFAIPTMKAARPNGFG